MNAGDDILQIQDQARRQKRNAQIIRIVVLFFLVVSVLFCLPMAVVLGFFIGPGLFSEAPAYINWVILLIVYCSFFVLPFVCSLPLVLPMALRCRNTSRILVFRKFNSAATGKALKKIIRSVIGNYGHVFTLSDRDFRIRWYVRIPVLLGQMSFFHFRQRVITKAANLDHLKTTLAHKGWLNINWLLSGDKIFSVKTNDEHWQATAQLLLSESSLVVIDVSSLTTALEWEATVTREAGKEHQILLLAHENNRQAVTDWKQRFDTPDDHDIPVFYYNDKGLSGDQALFEQSIATILAGGEKVPQKSYTAEVLKKTLVLSSAMLGTFGLIFLLICPYLFPNFTGQYSPVPRQAVTGYIQSLLATPQSEALPLIRERIRSKWPNQAAAVTISYAGRHEPADCEEAITALKDLAQVSKLQQYIKLAYSREAKVARAAAEIIDSFHLPGQAEIALPMIASPRLDIRENGLLLLDDTRLSKAQMEALLQTLSQYKDPPEKEPVPHRDARGLNFNWSHVLTFDERYTRYFLDFYDFLEAYELPVTVLRQQWQQAQGPDAKAILALLLLNQDDASGVGSLFDTHFLHQFFDLEVSRSNQSWFGRQMTFRTLTDALLAHDPLSAAPEYAVLVTQGRLQPGTALPRSLVVFLQRQYPGRDLHEFRNYFPSE